MNNIDDIVLIFYKDDFNSAVLTKVYNNEHLKIKS